LGRVTRERVEKPGVRWPPGGRVLGDLFALRLSA
jgi:hypothetical protein